jgi:uncharacterized membrane protein YheB (UPF0754 family)
MKMNKSLITNSVALIIIALSFYFQEYQHILFSVGIFALSGAVTNWLAIHMLFEKVPLLYGSGVIPNRFEDFKKSIKAMIISEFFNRQHIEKYLLDEASLNPKEILDNIDKDKAFNHFVDAISESSLGGMLEMFGGKKALEPLREPIEEKLEEIIKDLLQNKGADVSSNDNKSDHISLLIGKIENIIDKRLNDLTPEKVKLIVQDVIREHLGWLVVWGGFFGGLIGLVYSQY